MRRAVILAVCFLASSCAADVSRDKAAGAAAAVGFGVGAAGVYRAVTGECWADCRPGLVCDRASGTCVPLEPSPPKKRSAQAKATAPAGAVDEDPPRDPCRGLCFSGERCVVDGGVADCVAASDAGVPGP